MSKKILIIGPAWVGDMVMAQCLFKLLKRRDPDIVIDVLAPAWSVALLSRMPEVANAIPLSINHGQLLLGARRKIGKSLREQYQQAILLPNSFKSALIPWWANIPIRTGWRGEMRYGVLNDVRILDKKRYPLMIERFMALGLDKDEDIEACRDTTGKIAPHFLPTLQTSPHSQQAALTQHQIDYPEKPILALCPGAEFGPAKRWPEEYYAEVAQQKLAAGWAVWIFGSAKDKPVAEKIMQLTAQACVDFTGKTRLEEAIDLLALATIVATNDSGLMHIAAALQKPILALYGPTSSGFTPPLHSQAKVMSLALDCQPCFQRTCPLQHHRCMKELKPEKVLTAMSEWVN